MALLDCLEEDGTEGCSWGHSWVRRKGNPFVDVLSWRGIPQLLRTHRGVEKVWGKGRLCSLSQITAGDCTQRLSIPLPSLQSSASSICLLAHPFFDQKGGIWGRLGIVKSRWWRLQPQSA